MTRLGTLEERIRDSGLAGRAEPDEVCTALDGFDKMSERASPGRIAVVQRTQTSL